MPHNCQKSSIYRATCLWKVTHYETSRHVFCLIISTYRAEMCLTARSLRSLHFWRDKYELSAKKVATSLYYIQWKYFWYISVLNREFTSIILIFAWLCWLLCDHFKRSYYSIIIFNLESFKLKRSILSWKEPFAVRKLRMKLGTTI